MSIEDKFVVMGIFNGFGGGWGIGIDENYIVFLCYVGYVGGDVGVDGVDYEVDFGLGD